MMLLNNIFILPIFINTNNKINNSFLLFFADSNKIKNKSESNEKQNLIC